MVNPGQTFRLNGSSFVDTDGIKYRIGFEFGRLNLTAVNSNDSFTFMPMNDREYEVTTEFTGMINGEKVLVNHYHDDTISFRDPTELVFESSLVTEGSGLPF